MKELGSLGEVPRGRTRGHWILETISKNVELPPDRTTLLTTECMKTGRIRNPQTIPSINECGSVKSVSRVPNIPNTHCEPIERGLRPLTRYIKDFLVGHGDGLPRHFPAGPFLRVGTLENSPGLYGETLASGSGVRWG